MKNPFAIIIALILLLVLIVGLSSEVAQQHKDEAKARHLTEMTGKPWTAEMVRILDPKVIIDGAYRDQSTIKCCCDRLPEQP